MSEKGNFGWCFSKLLFLHDFENIGETWSHYNGTFDTDKVGLDAEDKDGGILIVSKIFH